MTIEAGAKFYVHRTRGHYTYRLADEVDRYPVDRDFRPLVVIDPEDESAVERLGKLMRASGCRWSTDVQTALREFANPTPPRPEEPQGLGAVVEDADGANYTRVGVDCWVRRGGGLLGFGYGEINVVRVLSEGVTP